MPYQHILLASGGAEHSRLAERKAVSVALALQAKLSLISVLRPQPLPGIAAGVEMAAPVMTAELYDQQQARQQRLLDDALKRCADYGLEPDGVLLSGDAGEQIVNLATERDCDLIIVGSRKLSLVTTIAFGSVSDYVMRRAPCDVLIAR